MEQDLLERGRRGKWGFFACATPSGHHKLNNNREESGLHWARTSDLYSVKVAL